MMESSVYYVLVFYVWSSTKKGYGRVAWRRCQATRKFKMGELPRITPKGEILHVAGLDFRCQGGVDRLMSNLMWSWMEFHLGGPKVIRGVPCYEETNPLIVRSLLEELNEDGFETLLGKPVDEQPTDL